MLISNPYSMLPDQRLITIENNEKMIKELVRDLIINPRILAQRWSKITHQTPNLKIGYPAQHLASLITGIKGNATAARGDDILDGTEVKSCSRVDQVDKCKKCKKNVLRSANSCENCGNSKITRNNDSKWLFTIKNKSDLELLHNSIPRILFFISDYLNFDSSDFNTIRFQAFEIWPKSSRQSNFLTILNNYYNKIYLEHKKNNPNKTPAPKNFWPESFQFYMCNPIKVFECIVKNSDSLDSTINITHYIKPNSDRKDLPSEPLPKILLNKEEIKLLKRKFSNIDELDFISEEMKQDLPLRDTDKISENKKAYIRRV